MMYRLAHAPEIIVGPLRVRVGDLVEITGAEPDWCASRAALRDGRLVPVEPAAPPAVTPPSPRRKR
jgi:hypothetical protein